MTKLKGKHINEPKKFHQNDETKYCGLTQGASYAGHSNKKWPNTSHRADIRSARGESGETSESGESGR